MKINRKRAYRITCASYIVIALVLIALGLMNLGGVAENSDMVDAGIRWLDVDHARMDII